MIYVWILFFSSIYLKRYYFVTFAAITRICVYVPTLRIIFKQYKIRSDPKRGGGGGESGVIDGECGERNVKLHHIWGTYTQCLRENKRKRLK